MSDEDDIIKVIEETNWRIQMEHRVWRRDHAVRVVKMSRRLLWFNYACSLFYVGFIVWYAYLSATDPERRWYFIYCLVWIGLAAMMYRSARRERASIVKFQAIAEQMDLEIEENRERPKAA
jgi:hypothetical protein